MNSHSPNPTIFREYDIRGVVGQTLFSEDAYLIGRAFGSKVAREKSAGKICVGYDGRVSSPDMQDALCRGLTECGHEVVHVGLGPTPMLYFSVCELEAQGGIMVTGSHNPPTHNGFKFMLGRKAFFGQAIRDLQAAIAAGDFTPKAAGKITPIEMKPRYIEKLLAAYTGKRDLKVAWDAGNGAAGEIMAALCERLPGTHLPLNATIDGTFPVHHPDPTVPENLAQLIASVRSGGYDLGIAFDGDGDRIGVVDDEGEILWGDQLLMLYAADVLHKKPGATIIADVKASQQLFDEIKKLGGVPLMWKTGHSHIKSKMVETGSPLAGEMSGHIFFADEYYGFDDALYAAIRILNIVAKTPTKLSAWRKALPTLFNTPELRMECPDTRKFAVIEEVRARLQAAKASFNDVDGMRVQTPDGWWLLRASNTQPVLVARCESASQAGLDRLKENLRAELSACGISPQEIGNGH